MKFAHPQMENAVSVEKNYVSSLIIENPDFFRCFLMDLHNQVNGENGEIILSDDLTILNIKKSVEIIDSFLSFSLNTKALLSKMISYMEKSALSENFYVKTEQLLTDIEKFIDELSDDLSCNISCDKLSVSSVLKMAGLMIYEDYENYLEGVLDYMELSREFDSDKIYVFVNMRSYFNDKDLEAFFETVISHEFKVLLIDNHAEKVLENEKRMVIDEDLCEF